MTKRLRCILGGGFGVVLGFGLMVARYGGAPLAPRAIGQESRADAAESRPADREAIAQLSREFRDAFEKGNAKAIAAFYTEQAEYHDGSTGEVFRGRAEVESAYADLFKEHPGSKIEVVSKSLRFVGRDTALQEGLVRLVPAGAALPTSAHYSCLWVREDGQWRAALEREWGADEDKLEDLSWLVGEWEARGKDRELHMNFRWNAKKTMLIDKFTVKEGGRVTFTGTQRIGLDPQTGRIRSWLIDQSGGRGDSIWNRDGNSWLLDSEGTLANGTQTSAVNIIGRVNNDAFTWRSISRRIGGEDMPATDPIKVVRVKTEN